MAGVSVRVRKGMVAQSSLLIGGPRPSGSVPPLGVYLAGNAVLLGIMLHTEVSWT